MDGGEIDDGRRDRKRTKDGVEDATKARGTWRRGAQGEGGQRRAGRRRRNAGARSDAWCHRAAPVGTRAAHAAVGGVGRCSCSSRAPARAFHLDADGGSDGLERRERVLRIGRARRDGADDGEQRVAPRERAGQDARERRLAERDVGRGRGRAAQRGAAVRRRLLVVLLLLLLLLRERPLAHALLDGPRGCSYSTPTDGRTARIYISIITDHVRHFLVISALRLYCYTVHSLPRAPGTPPPPGRTIYIVKH